MRKKEAGIIAICLYGRESEMGSEWVVQEFSSADLGDERRTERLTEFVCALSETPGGALSRACPHPASLRAALRFLDNDHFDDASLLLPHIQQTLRRICPEPLVYVPQDTTSVNYHHLSATTGLGRVGKSSLHIGLLMHSSLAITPGGVSLGLVHQHIWARTHDKRPDDEHKLLPLEDKESFKWVQGLRALNQLASECPATTLVSITDREGDLYHMFVHPRAPNVELLIRGTHNRATRSEDEKGYVFQELRSAPVALEMAVHVYKQDKRPARSAHLSIHFKKLTLAESKLMRENKKLSTGVPTVNVWAVLAEEKHPPPKVKPIRWLLYSTRPVESAEQALEAVQAYRCRWVIEVWHKTLKSGVKIEAKQADSAQRLTRSLTILSVIAWRIHHIMTLSREQADAPCTLCFEETEWKAAWCRHHRIATPPRQPPALRDFVRMLCKLSGFIGQKSEGEPGPKRIAMALDYLSVIADTYRVLTQSS